jgi:hypothetical protein
MGVPVSANDSSGVGEALAAVQWADMVVLALGSDTIDVEHEGTDRTTIGLPGLQV